ncbi:anti-phage dCTP deaminase [Acidovorax radicis]|uniref:anti-phage dCTP deaminase n=1 Tax=Acidovorax radicis TaxID=758826 RepID=UPI001CF8E5A1|nr:anti-phage dCTP deaminase [Acidovorax radicis]UCU99250.1 cytidine deaminase [Acidovorax radicis]
MSAVPTLNAVPETGAANDQNEKTAKDRIKGTHTPEIVVALCGPLGTPLHDVAKIFQELLRGQDYGYKQVEIIKLSSEIREMVGLPPEADIAALIKAGNDLREAHGRAVLVQRAIRRISLARLKKSEEKADFTHQPKLFVEESGDVVIPTPIEWTCHIIDSIKNEEELELLRFVYGDMLHIVGVYAPIEQRIARLQKKISRPEQIHTLINRDSGEEQDHGQQVQDTFPHSDFFLRVDTGTDSQLTSRVRRFLDLMLGTRIITPTVAERAMYAASSAAMNSACLSRQVGAALTSASGELIATGWNDVPRAFGGLYEIQDLRASPDEDHRCYNKDGGKCFNDEEKDLIANTVIDKMIAEGIVDRDKAEKAVKLIRHDSQLRSLIEFSRAVHAEMHALLNAGAQHGSKVRGGKLFVTTYPCHSCARHIVAAGVREVYFLEPYRKSLATKLHEDAITEQETNTFKVRIMPFDGVAPSRFLKFFEGNDRKDGHTGRMRKKIARPVTAVTMEAVSSLEGIAIKSLQ